MNNESKDTAMVNLVDEDFLRQKQAERERSREETALEGTLPLLHDRKKDIETIFEEEKIKTALKDVKTLLVSEIEKAVRDIMIVPEYSQKGAAKQEIYVYVGTHWKVLDIQTYYDYIKKACKLIGLSEIYYQDPEFMNKVFEQVAFSVSHHIRTVQPHDGVWINLRNLTVQVESGKSVQVESGKLKVESGMLKVESGGKSLIRTHEHRPEDFFKYCLPYEYDPNAECPLWHKFLDEVLPEKEAQTLLGEYVGYCFTQCSSLRLEKMAVFYGGGANGKSVCLDVIKRLIGRSNVSEATLSSVTTDPEVRSLLQNKLLNISSESGKNLDNAILKMLVSGEPVEMRILYVGTKLLVDPPKLITSYNELPKPEKTHGFYRRWILFPFNKTIPESQQDPSLANKLCMELPGILNWVLESLRHLVERVNSGTGEDFTESKVCRDALSTYIKSANSTLSFIDECCTINENSMLKLQDLFNCYKAYCVANNFEKLSRSMLKDNLISWGARITELKHILYFNVDVDSSVYLSSFK